MSTSQAVTAGLAATGLVGIDKVRNELNNKNLVIRIRTPGHPRDYINKVSYDQKEAENTLELVIEPHENFVPLTREKLEFSHQGVAADLIFCLGCQELKHLGGLFEKNGEIFTKLPIVNIDNVNENKDFGKINLVFPKAASISEIVAYLLSSLKLPVDEDIVSNIYRGIVETTNNFQREVSASTHEAAAFCLRQGAKLNQVGRDWPGQAWDRRVQAVRGGVSQRGVSDEEPPAPWVGRLLEQPVNIDSAAAFEKETTVEKGTAEIKEVPEVRASQRTGESQPRGPKVYTGDSLSRA